VHAAGNDAQSGNPSLTQPYSPAQAHRGSECLGRFPHTYCYSQNGTGTDCPIAAPFGCSAGLTYCEKDKHPTHGADTTIGLMPVRRTR